MDDADLGPRLLELLGEPACRELLAVLEWPELERAALMSVLLCASGANRDTPGMAAASDRIDDFFVASSLPWLPEEPIGSFRRACDPMVDLIEPHLTLVFAVPASVRFDVFRAHVRDVASQTTPFDIRLNGLEKSWDGYLLLLVAEGREEVVALHDALYSGILRPYLWTGGPYVPHVTIGRFIAEPDAHDLLEPRPRRLDSDRFEDALFKAESLDLDYEGRLDSVQIFGADEDLTHVARLEEIRLGDAVSS